MPPSPDRSRPARLIFAALVFVFGLQMMRFLFASLTWYLRDTLSIGVLDLVPISLAPFVLAIIVPLSARWLGYQRTLVATSVLLVAARLANQITTDPAIDFFAASIGTFAFVGLVPLIFGLGRSVIVVGVLLGLAVDGAIKGLGLSLDLAYQPGWRNVVAVGAMGLALLWGLLGAGVTRPVGVGAGASVSMLALAPFLFIQQLILQSQGWTSAVTGTSGPTAQLRIALLNVVAIYLAIKFHKSRLVFGLALGLVVVAAVTAEGAPPLFNLASLLAVPLAGVVWARLVPAPSLEGRLGWAGPTLVAALTLFLVLGLAYYLPLDLSLGFSQASVRIAAAVLLALVGLLAFRGDRLGAIGGKNDWVLAAVAAVLPALAYLGAITADTQVLDVSSEDPIRFMSYNVHSAFNVEGNLDVEAIARVVEDSGAEVVAFQELPRGRLISAGTDLMTLLQIRLGFEHVAYFGTTDPVWGNAVMSRFPILDSGRADLPLVGTPMQRGYLGALLQVGDETILAISTHLQHVNDSEVHDDDPEADLFPVHSEQIDTILSSWGGVEPAVLMGDFNARPGWRQIDQILDAGWVDSWSEVGIGEGFTTSATNPQYRIDYIFHTSDLAAVDAGVIQSTASDHFAVVADIVRK